jgi:hypothetical protein
MKQKLWIVAMAVLTLTVGVGMRAGAAPQARKSMCAADTCGSVFSCDWTCTICKFDADKTNGAKAAAGQKATGYCSPQP